MALIDRLHEQHVRKGISDPACLLCVEAARKAERRLPAWLRHLTAKELTNRGRAA